MAANVAQLCLAIFAGQQLQESPEALLVDRE